MTGEFETLPAGPLTVNDVKSWVHELNDIRIKALNNALAVLLDEMNAAPLAGASKAKGRVEHEIKRLTNLLTAMTDGLSRT
jgi:hypothetical protein